MIGARSPSRTSATPCPRYSTRTSPSSPAIPYSPTPYRSPRPVVRGAIAAAAVAATKMHPPPAAAAAEDGHPGGTTMTSHSRIVDSRWSFRIPRRIPSSRRSYAFPPGRSHDDDDDDDDGGEGRIPPPRLPPRPRSRPLHPLQERAILDVAYASITTIGEPCVYGIIVAVRDYLHDGLGLIQAGISMLLSDDCLVRILTYLGPRTVRDIEDVVDALPILRDASTRNAIWRPVCGTRWAGRWGYRDRWEGANRTYRHRRHDGGASAKTATTTTTTIVDDDDNRGYWMRAYHAEEADATRDTLSRSKLTSVTEMWTMGAQVRF